MSATTESMAAPEAEGMGAGGVAATGVETTADCIPPHEIPAGVARAATTVGTSSLPRSEIPRMVRPTTHRAIIACLRGPLASPLDSVEHNHLSRRVVRGQVLGHTQAVPESGPRRSLLRRRLRCLSLAI